MRLPPACLLVPLVLAACTVGPDYRPPESKAPPAFVEATTVPADPRPLDLARWWQGFADPELDRLVAIALAENLDVQTAISRVRQARLGVSIARSQALPTLDAAANAQHSETNLKLDLHPDAIEKIIQGSFGDALGGVTIPDKIDPPHNNTDTWTAGLDASWQLDVFGGVRRSVEAARARTEAAEWNERDAEVTLVSEVADSYLQLRQYQALEAVTQAELVRQNRELEIQQHRSRVGLLPETDFVRQRAQLASTQATLAPIQAQQRIQGHALAVLLARAPGDLLQELLIARPSAPPPPAVPPGLPSDLLRRRPDIRAAERNLAAANAEIGVAVADLYPRFSLTGAAQLMSEALGNFVTVTSRALTGGGAVSLPIFDGGRRHATVTLREEQRQEAWLAYRRTVLSAMRDVEDALVQLGSEQRRNASLRSGVADAQRAVQSVSARYVAGLASQTEVLDAQASVLQQQQQLATSDGSLRRDLVLLYRALGGGWSENGEAPQPPR